MQLPTLGHFSYAAARDCLGESVMLELLIYAVFLLVLMPAILLGFGKLVRIYSNKLSLVGRSAADIVATVPRYEGLHERLTAAAKANPLLPRWTRR